MNRVIATVRNSLAFKVIISTLVLSLTVIYIAGSALNSQLSSGIKQVNIDSALIEARSTIFSAQYRFVIAQYQSDAAIRKVVDGVISSATTLTTNENAREVILLRSPGNTYKADYERSSNSVDLQSIPNALRKSVRKSENLEWKYIRVNYIGGENIPGLAIGQKVFIPHAGSYEMYMLFSLTNQNATLVLIQNYLYLTGLFLVLLILLITWMVVRQVVRPVREAARIATDFTAGDFRQRMNVRSQDEISTLGNAFNEMAESLEKQITRLENLSRVQQRFVSDVSHELRTPLTTLRMASEVINSFGESFDPILARSSELMVAQLDRFERLLEDLLEISRFDAEVAELESVEFDMVALVKRCAEDLDWVAKRHSTDLRIYSISENITLSADIRRVERILRNLLTNAIDHAEEKPIAITIVGSEKDVAIGIRDYGIGLDESALPRVFDRFWRADPSRARTRGGTGLGLSIALEDARLHNGELEAWGRPGKGAHFVLTLPRHIGSGIDVRLIKLIPDDFRE